MGMSKIVSIGKNSQIPRKKPYPIISKKKGENGNFKRSRRNGLG